MILHCSDTLQNLEPQFQNPEYWRQRLENYPVQRQMINEANRYHYFPDLLSIFFKGKFGQVAGVIAFTLRGIKYSKLGTLIERNLSIHYREKILLHYMRGILFKR